MSRKRSETLITAALQQKELRQVELVVLLNRSKSTVRNHLRRLEEQGKIERIRKSGNVFYRNSGTPQKPTKPLPPAKDGTIGVMLDTIADSIGIIDKPDYSDYDTELSEFERELFPEEVSNEVVIMNEFYHKCKRRHHVLSLDENLNKCMSILDALTETFDKENQDSDVERSPGDYIRTEGRYLKNLGLLSLPDFLHEPFFASMIILNSNWKVGKENKDLHSELVRRTGPMVRNASRMSTKFGIGMQKLVLAVDKREAQEMFRRMVKYGNYDIESLRDAAWITYEEQNQLHELFRTLNEIEKQVAVGRKRKVQSLKEEIRDDYR